MKRFVLLLTALLFSGALVTAPAAMAKSKDKKHHSAKHKDKKRNKKKNKMKSGAQTPPKASRGELKPGPNTQSEQPVPPPPPPAPTDGPTPPPLEGP